MCRYHGYLTCQRSTYPNGVYGPTAVHGKHVCVGHSCVPVPTLSHFPPAWISRGLVPRRPQEVCHADNSWVLSASIRGRLEEISAPSSSRGLRTKSTTNPTPPLPSPQKCGKVHGLQFEFDLGKSGVITAAVFLGDREGAGRPPDEVAYCYYSFSQEETPRSSRTSLRAICGELDASRDLPSRRRERASSCRSALQRVSLLALGVWYWCLRVTVNSWTPDCGGIHPML